jgi:protein SCO1/2
MSKWLLVRLVALLLITACSQPQAKAEKQSDSLLPDFAVRLKGAVVDPPRPLQNFSAPSTQGTFTLADHRGKVILFYFGYMTCPDVCPATSAHLKWVYEKLGVLSEQVTVVFVTVDPERDSLDRISAWLGIFNEAFIGLRPEGEALTSIMTQFGAVATKQQLNESALSYLMDHTASVFLIDPQGRVLEQFLFGTPFEDIAHDVRLILENS